MNMFEKKKKTEKKDSPTKNSATKKPVNKTPLKSKGGESLPLAPASKLSFATPSAVSNADRNAANFLYISNDAHYDQVIERIKDIKKTLWIGTADIKDLYVKDGRSTKPLLEVLSDLEKKGVAK